MHYRIPLFGALAIGLGACTSTPPVMAVPESLNPGPNEVLAMVVPAKGVQIYECRAGKETNAGYQWAFVAPDAELLDARGNVIGRHGAGPYWQAADGSRIQGTVKARADAPAGNAIPWLLLTTPDTGTNGAFSGVTSIQRVNTAGGVAPNLPCSAQIAGKQMKVHYVADYRFFTAR